MKNKEIQKLEKAVLDIQEKIKELKNEKPEFEVGKWYIGCNNFPFFITEHKKDEWVYCYGFDLDGDWFDENQYSNRSQTSISNIKRPATNEEVEAALISEAKKRGFKKGVKFDCLLNHNDVFFSDFWCTSKPSVGLWAYGQKTYNGVFFKDGQWAEIIEEPKVIINGYEMEQDGDIISFGCAKFSKFQLNSYIEFFKRDAQAWGVRSNRTIKSITLDSGVEITIEQLEQIVKNLK